jgi:integrase
MDDASFTEETHTPQELADIESQHIADLSNLLAMAQTMEVEYSYPNFTRLVRDHLLDDTLTIPERYQAVSEIFANLIAHKTKAENQLNKAELEEAFAISSDPASYKPKSPISASSIKLFHEHLTTQHSNTATIKNIMSKVTKFSNYLDREGSLLSFDSVASFLNEFPKASTRKGYIWGLTAYHEWAVLSYIPYRKQFAGLVSPFDKHKFAKAGKGAKQSWTPYTQQEAERLHKAALGKGDIELAHLIQFAAYTGARLEEIGRISKLTTVFEDGLPTAFNVEDSKTAAGIRTVPIHSQLLPLYVQLLEQSEDGYLLKGKLNSGGFRLSIPQGRFSKLKQSLGFSRLHVFHSFRGCVITTLEQAGVSPLAITSLVGHKRNSVTFDTYSAGASFKQKKDAIERLHYNF